MIHTIKQEYNKLSRKEQKAIYWALKILGSEASKVLIISLFFLCIGKLPELIFTMIVLLPIRTKMGGLHFKTYWGCLFVTALLFIFAVIILPYTIPVNKAVSIILLAACTLINLLTKPVINPTRPTLSEEKIRKSRWRIGLFMVTYIAITYVFYNQFIICGMWIIVEQTLQLLIAKIMKRGEE